MPPGLARIEDDLQAMCIVIHNGGKNARADINLEAVRVFTARFMQCVSALS